MPMQKRGLTLLEIIIALFVFAVGTLAVVKVITTNISVIDRFKLKIQAQSLAKEGIDIVFNIRDTNLTRSLDWNCAYLSPGAIAALQSQQLYAGQICGAHFADANGYGLLKVEMDPAGKIVASATTTGADLIDTFGLNQLMLFTGADYTGGVLIHSAGEPSTFARYISFEPVLQSGSVLDVQKLLKVTSHVIYIK